jgi:hypothetical protein
LVDWLQAFETMVGRVFASPVKGHVSLLDDFSRSGRITIQLRRQHDTLLTFSMHLLDTQEKNVFLPTQQLFLRLSASERTVFALESAFQRRVWRDNAKVTNETNTPTESNMTPAQDIGAPAEESGAPAKSFFLSAVRLICFVQWDNLIVGKCREPSGHRFICGVLRKQVHGINGWHVAAGKVVSH